MSAHTNVARRHNFFVHGALKRVAELGTSVNRATMVRDDGRVNRSKRSVPPGS